MKKLLSIGICLLIIALLPSIAGMQKAEQTTDTEVQFIFGVFPKVSEGQVSFLSLSPPGSITISEEDFRGHIGTIFIIGFYNPASM